MNESNSPKKKKNNPYHNFLNALDSYNARLSFYKGHRLQNMIQCQYQSHYSMYRKDYEQSQLFYTQNGMYVPDNSYVLWQLEHETYIKPNALERIRVNKAREKITIDVNIQTIDDLLSIIEKNTIDPLKDYNIDLKALHLIKEELTQLNSMIGLTSLKKSILRQMMYFIQGFANDPKDGDYKHTILTGPPGTGKTEIAKIMGNMYSKVGVLKKNVFKKVTRTDLVAGYLGQTAIKTRKVIDECMGGVLFIDEAYSLQYDDSYSKECIDTLCEALSDNKNDLMVIVAGYQKELDNHFFRINEGMRSRFIWRFDIESYGTKELYEIFNHLATIRTWEVNDSVVLKWFETKKEHFKDNGRSMEQLFSYAKVSHAQRIYGQDESLRKKLTIEDLDEGFKLYKEYGNSHKKDNISLSLYT